MGTVAFPGLGLEFQLNRVAFQIGSWPVYLKVFLIWNLISVMKIVASI